MHDIAARLTIIPLTLHSSDVARIANNYHYPGKKMCILIGGKIETSLQSNPHEKTSLDDSLDDSLTKPASLLKQ